MNRTIIGPGNLFMKSSDSFSSKGMVVVSAIPTGVVFGGWCGGSSTGISISAVVRGYGSTHGFTERK